jgi:hypothetical protein
VAVSGVRVRDADASEVPDDVVSVRVGAPVCDCHGIPKAKNGHTPKGTQKWICRIKRNERAKRDYYGKVKTDPARLDARRRYQREKWPERFRDPLYKTQRYLSQLARVRVRY